MDSIVFAGNILVDNVKTIAAWPEKGMLVPITAMARAVGGSVCNSGIDLKTLDPSLTVKALGKVGNDDAGDFAIGTLMDRGLDVSLVSRADAPTTFTDVMTVAGTGERTFFNMHGADSAMSAHAATYNPVADREGREVYNRMYQRSEFPLPQQPPAYRHRLEPQRLARRT